MTKTKVEQGQVTVNSVTLTAWGRNLRVYEIDTKHKYPELATFSDRDVQLTFSDSTPARQREGREDMLPTKITFDVPKGWEPVHERTGRYSMKFTFHKPRKRYRPVWQRQYEFDADGNETEG